MAQDMGQFSFDSSSGAPPDVVGAVVAWLAANPDAAEARVGDGRVIDAQAVCRELDLVPGWPSD